MSVVDWVVLTGTAAQAGDLVSAEAGGMPIYRIVAVENDRAWVQGERPAGEPELMRLDHFRWKAAQGPTRT